MFLSILLWDRKVLEVAFAHEKGNPVDFSLWVHGKIVFWKHLSIFELCISRCPWQSCLWNMSVFYERSQLFSYVSHPESYSDNWLVTGILHNPANAPFIQFQHWPWPLSYTMTPHVRNSWWGWLPQPLHQLSSKPTSNGAGGGDHCGWAALKLCHTLGVNGRSAENLLLLIFCFDVRMRPGWACA